MLVKKRKATTGTALAPGYNSSKAASHFDTHDYRTYAMDPSVIAGLQDAHALAPDPNELELRELRAELAERLIQIAEDVGTERQRTILRLWLSGKYTQLQIGELCGVCQTTVFKTLNGNDTYLPDGRILRYGGLLKKIEKAAQGDPLCSSLLARIAELV
jgi:DNA-binding CsgD family transcriptional regulator